MPLAKTLNNLDAWPQTNKGKVTLEPEGIAGHGYLDAHPEGADRGGYVPFWFFNNEAAFHNGEEWVKTNKQPN